jgi:Domain of Unknown Function (DUF1080)
MSVITRANLRGKMFVPAFLALAFCATAFSQNAQWLPNDVARPVPPAVTPGSAPSVAPSDAIVLFDGTSMAAWAGRDGSTPAWPVKDGAFEVAPGSGNIHTKQSFGDCQLHVEWAEPAVVRGSDQSRGNSGIMLMSMYELQVLDAWQNPTYADGTVGGIYGQYPPLVIAGRKPGEWQTYDIIFRRARFDENGQLLAPARITVIQNGVAVQDNTRPTGPTAFHDRPPYMKGPDAAPITLQDHGSAVQFRNIWIRNLPDKDPDLAFTTAVAIHVDPKDMALYAGHYEGKTRLSIDFAVGPNGLTAQMRPRTAASAPAAGANAAGATGQAGRGAAPRTPAPPVQLTAVNHDTFIGEWEGNSMRVTFARDNQNQVTGALVQQAETYSYADKIQ